MSETEKAEDRAGQLEDKTGQLEKRLRLRQFITKALEIKRAEIVDITEPGESGLLSPKPAITSFPGSITNTPQKLTFYDVVQLARQQSLATRTWKPSEDLIDLSDTPQPMLNSDSSINVPNDLCLLDSSSVMDFRQIDFSLAPQNDLETPKSSQAVDLKSARSTSPGMDVTIFQKSSDLNLLDIFDSEASQAAQTDDLHTKESRGKLAAITNLPVLQAGSPLANREPSFEETSVTFKMMSPEVSQADDSKRPEAANSPNPLPTCPIHSTEFITHKNDTGMTSAIPENASLEVSQINDLHTHEISELFSSWTSLDQLSLPIHQFNTAPIGHEKNSERHLLWNPLTWKFLK